VQVTNTDESTLECREWGRISTKRKAAIYISASKKTETDTLQIFSRRMICLSEPGLFQNTARPFRVFWKPVKQLRFL
jgi:hypothetical protein